MCVGISQIYSVLIYSEMMLLTRAELKFNAIQKTWELLGKKINLNLKCQNYRLPFYLL